jgi:hypothetical protein
MLKRGRERVAYWKVVNDARHEQTLAWLRERRHRD